MAVYEFGSGTVFGTRTDIANPTPWKFGELQDIQIDVNFDLKELFGQLQFPVTVARAKAKVPFKCKLARIQAQMFNDIFFGGTKSTGMVTQILGETGAIPTTPFQLTAAQTATFVADMGVTYVATGLPLLRVAAGPVTGQYSVSAAGVYTFAAADVGLTVSLNYTYTAAAVGATVLVTNQLMGSAPVFSLFCSQTYAGKQFNIKLFQCISNKLVLPTKQEDFEIFELDGMAFADAGGNVLAAYSAE